MADRMVATQPKSQRANQETDLEAVYLDPELVKSLQHRLTCLEGHIRGVSRMVAAARHARDQEGHQQNILYQTLAVKAALSQVIIRVLEGHIELCLIEYLRQGAAPPPMDRLKEALNLVLKESS